MSFTSIPDAGEIYLHPEFGTLVILDAALAAGINTLAAAHHGMCDLDDPTHPYQPHGPLSSAARPVITGAVSLRSKLRRYLAALEGDLHGELCFIEEYPPDRDAWLHRGPPPPASANSGGEQPPTTGRP
jgi:hypothetical protein